MAGQSLKHSGFFHSLIAYFAFGFYTFVNFTAILRDGLENRLTYFRVMQGEIPELLFFTLHLLPIHYCLCVVLLKATFRGSLPGLLSCCESLVV